MGQYYYRPIPSGYAEAGRAIATGITGGTENFYAGKENQRRREIEDTDRARRRQREDLDLDVMLASAGGGRGMAPDAPTIGRPEVGSALNDRRGISAAPGPDRSRDFRQMGDFYIEDPGSRATRMEGETFELTQNRAADERTRRGTALGAAGRALTGGGGTDADYEAFYGEKVDPLAAVRESRPKPPVRGTAAYMDMLEDEAEIAQRYRGQADDETPELGSIEFNRVFDIVESMAQERNPEGYITGSSMTESQLISTTEALLRGEDPFGDEGATAREVIEGSMEGYPDPDVQRVMSSVERGAPASALLGGSVTTPSPALEGEASVTDQSIDSIIRANPEASDDELVELLRQRR